MQQLTLNNTKSIHNKNWKLIEHVSWCHKVIARNVVDKRVLFSSPSLLSMNRTCDCDNDPMKSIFSFQRVSNESLKSTNEWYIPPLFSVAVFTRQEKRR